MMHTASPLSNMPPSLIVLKNEGPTCKPIENTNRIKPNSWMNFKVLWLIKASSGEMRLPMCPIRMPTNSTNVAPSDMPRNFTLPKITPMAITME